MSTTCTLAISAWQVAGIAVVSFGLAIFIMWIWFIALKKGDWS